ncbi:hypothetical protein [Roseovarius sp. 2305UL8-3]|uniref:hypothetical protein n=1 Tax=Roseovarius conchicola TaxID=3121636 RepID=UPI0035299F49
MTKPKPGKPAPKTGETREDRLKAALKANMGRRKAQARARAEDKPLDNKGKR